MPNPLKVAQIKPEVDIFFQLPRESDDHRDARLGSNSSGGNKIQIVES